MGLDMYAYAIQGEDKTEIAYWRKHNALHAWMEQLYRDKGGLEEFNVEPVTLTAHDLDRLEAAIKGRTLKPTPGFFFGSTTYTEEDWAEHEAEDLEFVRTARDRIANGFEVYYISWW